MRCAILVFAALLAACGGGGDESGAAGNAFGNRARSAPAAAASPDYVARVIAADQVAIASARLGLERADSAEVSGLAQMILSDHERMSRQLGSTLAEIQPPLAPAVDLDQLERIEVLRSARGAAFDLAWLEAQVEAHEQALDLATAYARAGASPSLRRHAAATIVPIQTHLVRARRLEAEVLAEQARIANSSEEQRR